MHKLWCRKYDQKKCLGSMVLKNATRKKSKLILWFALILIVFFVVAFLYSQKNNWIALWNAADFSPIHKTTSESQYDLYVYELYLYVYILYSIIGILNKEKRRMKLINQLLTISYRLLKNYMQRQWQ